MKDYEDTCFEPPEDDINDEDLANWTFDYWGNLHTSIEKLAAIVEKMCVFSKNTKNFHKEMKGWCSDLEVRTKYVQKRCAAIKPFVEKSADRIEDLSSSLLEVSSMSTLVVVQTHYIGVGTDNGGVLECKRGEEQYTTHANIRNRKNTENGHRKQAKLPEEKKKKAKMKYPKGPKKDAPNEREPANSRRKYTTRRGFETVLVRPSGTETYVDVAKQLKKNIDITKLGVNIKAMKSTDSGDIALQVERGPNQKEEASILEEAVKGVLGEKAVVEHSPVTTLVEIHDLEPETSDEEIKEAIQRSEEQTQADVQIIRIRSTFGGCKTALIKLQEKVTSNLLRTGRLVDNLT